MQDDGLDSLISFLNTGGGIEIKDKKSKKKSTRQKEEKMGEKAFEEEVEIGEISDFDSLYEKRM